MVHHQRRPRLALSLRLLADANWSRRAGPRRLQIALATFSVLALELALIRWMSGQIRILAYFNNLILIGCFLGMGLGLVAGRRWPGLVHLALPALALLCVPFAFAQPLHLMALSFPDPSIYLWGADTTAGTISQFALSFGILIALFCGIVGVFLCVGGAAGHLLGGTADLGDYSADLYGSLAGVLAMTAVNMLNTTPPVWLLLGGLPLLWLSRRVLSAVALTAVLLLAQHSVDGALFSPYNRIDLGHEELGLTLSVNRDFHQYMHDLSDGALASAAAAQGPRNPKQTLRAMYDIPFTINDHRDRALVIGAGTGNDVQAALRNGYRSVTSVDIDGRIIAIGKALHPEHPYADPRAQPVVNDGRAFLEQYDGPPFDAICYGFVDSHAMFSALSSLRLDNYLYTEEGLRAAYRHLSPSGHLTVSLSLVGGTWLGDRIYYTLARASGGKPIMAYHRLHGGATFLVGRGASALHLDRLAGIPLLVPRTPEAEVVTSSDDWPFLYIRPGVFPWGYLLVFAAVLLIAAFSSLWIFDLRQTRRELDPTLFLLGAAFLLLETRGVTTLSVLFGSTWVVNAAVFAGVLLVALIANRWVQRHPPRNATPWFFALFVAVLVVWAVDAAWLNRLPLIARGLAGGVINALPIGFAGVLVSMLLQRAKHLGAALGSNLLGSVAGGCLEYLSMAVGLRALALVALACYLLAFLAYRRLEFVAGGDR